MRFNTIIALATFAASVLAVPNPNPTPGTSDAASTQSALSVLASALHSFESAEAKSRSAHATHHSTTTHHRSTLGTHATQATTPIARPSLGGMGPDSLNYPGVNPAGGGLCGSVDGTCG